MPDDLVISRLYCTHIQIRYAPPCDHDVAQARAAYFWLLNSLGDWRCVERPVELCRWRTMAGRHEQLWRHQSAVLLSYAPFGLLVWLYVGSLDNPAVAIEIAHWPLPNTCTISGSPASKKTILANMSRRPMHFDCG